MNQNNPNINNRIGQKIVRVDGTTLSGGAWAASKAATHQGGGHALDAVPDPPQLQGEIQLWGYDGKTLTLNELVGATQGTGPHRAFTTGLITAEEFAREAGASAVTETLCTDDENNDGSGVFGELEDGPWSSGPGSWNIPNWSGNSGDATSIEVGTTGFMDPSQSDLQELPLNVSEEEDSIEFTGEVEDFLRDRYGVKCLGYDGGVFDLEIEARVPYPATPARAADAMETAFIKFTDELDSGALIEAWREVAPRVCAECGGELEDMGDSVCNECYARENPDEYGH